MKKILKISVILVLTLLMIGCTETDSRDVEGNKKREFNITETALVNNTEIKINSVEKLDRECSWEYKGKCESYNKPDGDYFIIIDLTIENKGEEDMTVSSMLSFELKNDDGEKGEYSFLLNAVKSQLDGTIMPGDKLKGQIGFDVNDSENFAFYFKDGLLDNPIKFVFSKSDLK